MILVSDHGMHVDTTAVDDPETRTSGHHQDAPPGVVAVMGPQFKVEGSALDAASRADLGHVMGVPPLVLRLLEIPVPSHWPMARNNTLEELVLDEWRRDHPRVPGDDPDGDFRPATPARLPLANVDEQFNQSFEDLGYMGEGDE